jgi:hypothetical protein
MTEAIRTNDLIIAETESIRQGQRCLARRAVGSSAIGLVGGYGSSYVRTLTASQLKSRTYRIYGRVQPLGRAREFARADKIVQDRQ